MKGEVELLADAVETRVCRFACDVCLCSCQATFMENKRHTIANGLKKNELKCKPVETRKSQREGGRSLFFDYVRNNLDNYTVREFQDVDSRFLLPASTFNVPWDRGVHMLVSFIIT
jgi:hypothetical protein